jgi:uncharacterized protein
MIERLDHPFDLASGIRACASFPRPVFLELMLTEACNLRCEYCWEPKAAARHMSSETALRAVDRLLANRDDDLHIFFFGGEPLLRLDVMREVVGEVRRRGRKVHYSMTTNGTLLDEETAGFLAESGITYLLSLDGGREMHDRHRRTAAGEGTWDSVVSRLRMLKSLQPWQGARVTVTPGNVQGLAEGVQALFERGINQFIIGPAHGLPWPAEAEAELTRQFLAVTRFYHATAIVGKQPMRCVVYEKGEVGETQATATQWGCGAGRGRLCATPDGRYFGCSKMATIHGASDGILPLGTVAEGLTGVANRGRLNTISIVDYPVACRICDSRKTCGGGCYATNQVESGSITCQSSGFHCMCSRVYAAVQQEFARLQQAAGGDAHDS